MFLWAVLLNRRELAQLMWRAGKDHIGNSVAFIVTNARKVLFVSQEWLKFFDDPWWSFLTCTILFLLTGAALIASALLKSLAKEAAKEEEIDLSQDLTSHAQ